MASDLIKKFDDIMKKVKKVCKKSNGDQKAMQSMPPHVTEIQINVQTEEVQMVEKMKQNFEIPYKPADATNLFSQVNAFKINLITPPKQKTTRIYSIPSQESNRPSTIKTPEIPVSQKKNFTSTETSLQRVVSPVATYIEKRKVVPLIKNVRSKKALVARSAIPLPIKSTLKANLYNKENIKLPYFAYKAAKATITVGI